MLLGCMDTSTDHASFVLFNNDECILSISKECKKGASKLLPWIRSQVEEKGFTLASINEWRIGIGPGSFTGMRVGIAFVKGICFASGAQFRGVNSGYGFLYTLLEEQPDVKEISVLHDGRRQEVISNSFELVDGEWVEKGAEVLKIKSLESLEQNGRGFITNMERDCFPEGFKKNLVCTKEINAGFFKNLNRKEFSSLEEMDMSCEPIYVRPPVFVQPLSK